MRHRVFTVCSGRVQDWSRAEEKQRKKIRMVQNDFRKDPCSRRLKMGGILGVNAAYQSCEEAGLVKITR